MKYTSRGFSLFQVMAAIVFLGVALSGTVLLVALAREEIALNKNRIIGLYLAQECLELTRNARDSAWRQNLPWNCSFENTMSEYRIWPDHSSMPAATTTSCQNELGLRVDASPPPFYLSQKNNLFLHEIPWDPSSPDTILFQRKFFLSDIEYPHNDSSLPPHKVTITCQVSWPQKGGRGMVELSHILTDWHQK